MIDFFACFVPVQHICKSWYSLLDVNFAPAVEKVREETWWFMELAEKHQASLVPVDNPDTADLDQVHFLYRNIVFFDISSVVKSWAAV